MKVSFLINCQIDMTLELQVQLAFLLKDYLNRYSLEQ
jgi:hypothetical protein